MELLFMARPTCRTMSSEREYISIECLLLPKFLGGSEAMRFKGEVKCFEGAEDNSRDNL